MGSQEPISKYENILRSYKANIVPVFNKARVLDVGIGSGHVWEYLELNYPNLIVRLLF